MMNHSETTFITDWIGRWALYAPNNVLLELDGGRSWTYAQAHNSVNQLANILRDEYHVSKGDRVAILSQNEPEYLFLFFAVQKIEAVLVPLNYRLAVRELHYVLDDAQPSLFVYQKQYSPVATDITTSAGIKSIVFEELIQRLDDTQIVTAKESKASPENVCMILYTSGTTGQPKGAMITNGMLFWNSINTGLRLNLTQHDTTLVFAPFFHTGGWNVLTTPFIHRGGKLIMIPRFDPDRVLRLCDEQGVTILFGVPTMMDMMYRSESFSGAKLAHLRYAVVGGEPMPLGLIETWHKKGVPIRQGYGLTEFGPNVFSLNEEDAIRKIGSIGFPNFYIEARVVSDDGADVGVNERGELILRGPVCMKGYWNNAEATQNTIRDGWLYTGDIVRRDEEGYFYVVDRKKDMFISGAENLYPAEIEQYIRTHKSVREVAVIGVPDEKWGESGMAFVVLNNGEKSTSEEIINFCTGNLAKYKIPRYVRFIEALPKSDSGKILKRQLHEMV
ncbi:MAG: long-chain fatty acid--CoA ligase [Balneolales bacterium]|nr:long-chain fatty acid--CoA ligase [Balneolales bacterium]